MPSRPDTPLSEMGDLDLSDALVIPYHPDNPKFSKITAQLEDPKQIMQLHLLKKPTIVHFGGAKTEPNDHMEHKEIDESAQDLPPPQGAVVAEGFDGSRTAVALWFDDYFRLASMEMWDNPKFALITDPDSDSMEVKMKNAAPYNVFFNSLKFSPRTHKKLNSINFTDLLCPSLGTLKATLHVTYMVKIWWLLSNYAQMKLHKLPMTILHGYYEFAWPELETMSELFPNIDYHYIEIYKNGPLGHHHTKLSIYMYDDDSLRVVAGTANLFGADWELYNNQVWVSPKCPKLPPGSCQTDGESPTGFKAALLKYLTTYKDDNQIPTLQGWLDAVATADFSEVKVMLLYNTPGEHYPRSNGCMLHYIGEMLTRHCTIAGPKVEHNSWRIVAQSSSIGLLGETPEQWLTTQFLRTLASNTTSPYYPTVRTHTAVKFSLVYPTIENCLQGYLGYRSAVCGKYERGLRQRQYWLTSFMCQWKADGTNRTKAMPHSKCYFRISPCWQKMAFYFMTSANLSRSGWGKPPNRNGTIYVRSYEIGLLFLPKFFGEDYFETTKVFVNRRNLRPFPLTVDLPLTPYTSEDEPYCWDDMLIQLGMPIEEKPPEAHARRNPRIRGRFGGLKKTRNINQKLLHKPIPIPRRGRVPIPYDRPRSGRGPRGGQRGALSRSTSLGSLAWDVTRTSSKGNFVNEMLYRSGSNSSLPSESLYRSGSRESLRSPSLITAGSSRGRGTRGGPRGTNRGGNRARGGRGGWGWSRGRDPPAIAESARENEPTSSSGTRYIPTSRNVSTFEPKSTTNMFFPKF